MKNKKKLQFLKKYYWNNIKYIEDGKNLKSKIEEKMSKNNKYGIYNQH